MSEPKKRTSADLLSLRIIVIDPPPNLSWALQLGRDELVKPTSASKARISFDFTVKVADDPATDGIRLSGPAVQGRPGEKFVYLCIRAYAGQTDAPAGWRAKIRLEGITKRLVAAARARPSALLEVQFMGTGPKGGPACATVPLLGSGWGLA